MAAPFTSKQAKEAFIAKVRTAVGPDPKLYAYNCLNYKVDKDGKPDFGEWPSQFPTADGTGVHGWVIKRVELDADLRINGCQDKSWIFELTGLYLFRAERVETSPGSGIWMSSDDEWDMIVDKVADEINSESLITINNIPVQHFGVQFKTTVMRCGQKLMHYAGGHVVLQFPT